MGNVKHKIFLYIELLIFVVAKLEGVWVGVTEKATTVPQDWTESFPITKRFVDVSTTMAEWLSV